MYIAFSEIATAFEKANVVFPRILFFGKDFWQQQLPNSLLWQEVYLSCQPAHK